MVYRIMEHGTGNKHDAAAGAIRTESGGMDGEAAADDVSCAGGAADGGSCVLFRGLAGASELRRILEAVVDRESLRANPGAGFQSGRVVRHFSGRNAAELCAAEEGGGDGRSAAHSSAAFLPEKCRTTRPD